MEAQLIQASSHPTVFHLAGNPKFHAPYSHPFFVDFSSFLSEAVVSQSLTRS